MKAINWVVGLLSLSAYGIGNTAFAYPAAAPDVVGNRSTRVRKAIPAARP